MGLMLRRKVGECVVIDDKTLVRVCHNQYGQLALFIEAPAEVRVDRLELYLKRGGKRQPHWQKPLSSPPSGS